MAAMTESQFKYLVSLTCQAYSDPSQRAAELLQLAGLDFAGASTKIDALKPQAKATTAAAVTMPAYIPPFGHYLVDGKHVHVKKAKYGNAVYVVVDEVFLGTVGKSANATNAIIQLDSDAAAYAAVVEFAKKTGKCGVCHTKLTDPKSIAAGIGPVCAKKYGIKI